MSTGSQEPAAPARLAHRLVALNRVDLSWADHSSNEDGFEIQRRIGSGSYVPLARVAANTTGFSDTSVAQNQTYTYRVLAFNGAGSSAASDETIVIVTCKTKGKSLNCQSEGPLSRGRASDAGWNDAVDPTRRNPRAPQRPGIPFSLPGYRVAGQQRD